MAITNQTRIILQKNLAIYEGYINYLYLDTKGNVTVGVGHLIPNKNSVSGIILYKVQNKLLTQLATLQEKIAEYSKIAKLPWGKRYTAESFESHSNLRMKNSNINVLLDKNIDKFYMDLKNIYKKDKGFLHDFDDFDSNVQLALFDMIFNLGATKLVNGFPKFNRAIKSNNFKKAAKESHRLDVDHFRNQYISDLFLNTKIEALENE